MSVNYWWRRRHLIGFFACSLSAGNQKDIDSNQLEEKQLMKYNGVHKTDWGSKRQRLRFLRNGTNTKGPVAN